MKRQVVQKNDHVTAPEAVHKLCPINSCQSADLFAFDGDVFCNACGWNSIENRVASMIDDHVERWKQQKAMAIYPLTYGLAYGT